MKTKHFCSPLLPSARARQIVKRTTPTIMTRMMGYLSTGLGTCLCSLPASRVDYGNGDDDEDDDDVGGVLIPGENCLSLRSDPTSIMTTSSSNGGENLSSFSSATTPPPFHIVTSFGVGPLQHHRPVRSLRHEIPFLTPKLWGDDGTIDLWDEAELEALVERMR